jgi:hypothetical protein
VEGLVNDVCRLYHTSIEVVLETASRFYPEVSLASYQEMVESAAPIEWMRHEIIQAVRLLSPRPVLVGLETVRFPGVIEIQPAQVQEMIATGLQAGVQGAVISWDLLHTPLENIQACQRASSRPR